MLKPTKKQLGIINSEYHDPFEILGAHPTHKGKRTSIRLFRPDKLKAAYLLTTDMSGKLTERVMKELHDTGYYQAEVNADIASFSYRFRLVFDDGSEKEVDDPYRFPPVLTELDLYLFNEGKNSQIYEKLGAHKINLAGVDGLFFAVWAPNAKRVSVVGQFNDWDGRLHQMRIRGESGIWELFMPGLGSGELYKFEVKAQSGDIYLKSDPYGFFFEHRPDTAGIVYDIGGFAWSDEEWISKREATDHLDKPVSIYEVHLGSWARTEDANTPLSYRDIAVKIVDYIKKLGYTHIQLMPVCEYPFDASWGYQVTGYFAPTSRYGEPADFAYLIDYMHQHGIGVIIDWVPAHFPKDSHGLAFFDGSHLYEHEDPRKGEHQDWGTLIFNYGRNEVRNFLHASGLFWVEKYHVDGLRVDAVASMLYLDYSRNEGEWIPNKYGGRENLEAVAFIKEFNEEVYKKFPGIMMIAEESTSWPAVSRPTYLGGLGFGFKWNMGWMNDTLRYFSLEPVHRKYHQDMLTFSLIYAFHENFILVLSHDEVVHGKRSLLDKMPGDLWQKFANLRLLFCYFFAHPGKKLLFMGGDFGQWEEWNFEENLKWNLLEYDSHKKLQHLVCDLNRITVYEPAFHEVDYNYTGFEWIDFSDTDNCVISFIRRARNRDNFIVCIFNMTPVPRENYRVGVPAGCNYRIMINSDAEKYWGSDFTGRDHVAAEAVAWQDREYSIRITLPPLGALFLKPA